MTESKRPFKILCLHGYRQDAKAFREKSGAFRKAIGKKAEFTFITAPHRVPSQAATEDENSFGWWFSQENDSFEAHQSTSCDKGFQASLDLVADALRTQGPFDGVVGFSQGAALLLLMCLRQAELKLTFSFAILVAPFFSRSSQHAPFFVESEQKIQMPCLIVIGDTDKVIEPEMSDEVLPLFANATVVRHPGGHFIPATSAQKKVYNEFLDQVRTQMADG